MDEDMTGFFPVEFRRSLPNQIASLEGMIYRLNLAKLTSHIHCISPEAEATLFIEHLFSAIRDQTKLQMPDLLACARGLTTANLIQMIIGGAGISGRRLESTATLLGKRLANSADYSLERESTLFDIL